MLLAGATGATAQDRTNIAPFSTSAPYAGDVLSNTSSITNNGTGGSWVGSIVSNAGSVANTGVGALWTGSVSNDNSVNNENGARWVGDIVWNNNGIRNKVGSTWEGDVLSNGGSNSLTLIDNRGTWIGAVRGNTTRIFSYGGSWTGDVVGNAGNIYNNAADNPLNPGGVNAALWSGNVLSNSYLIINFALGRWQGNVVDNPGNIANYGNWTGNLVNRGGIINTGVWTGDVINSGSLFRAENQIIGSLDNRGRVQLTGSLSGITTLTNSGRLELTYTAGSQTLSVASAVFTPTSSYEINVNSAGATDKIVVSGNAALAGTVHVVAATSGAPYASPTTNYTILSAGSISGQFASVTTDLAFFAPHISYDATAAYLTLKRNDVGFTATGATGNQAGVGDSVELLGAGNPLYDAVLWLTPEEAQDAFDQLSGEAHASTETMSVENANLVGGVAMNRMSQSFGDLGTGGSASGYAASPVLDARPATDTAFWTQFYGAVGLVAAGTSTAPLTAVTGGVAIGLGGVGITLRDLVSVYAAIARGGSPVKLQDGVLPVEPEPTGAAQVLDPVASWYVANILADVPPPLNGSPGRIAYKTGTSYGYRDAWAIGFDGKTVIGVWVGRPDNVPVPGISGMTAAAPILFESFDRLGAPATPLRSAPPGVLFASNPDLPAPLRRFRHPDEQMVARDAAPEIAFPSDGVDVDLGLAAGSAAPLMVKVRNGIPPFTFFANGAPFGRTAFARQESWKPDGPGFVTLSVVDAEGRSDVVTVFLN